jgi:riboflavin biosynthesis pyrimidine reductase
MEAIHTLFDSQQPGHSPVLPDELYSLYGGDLRFPLGESRPYTVANFVTTLDGVVSYNIRRKSGGSEISGFNEADHFIMGLLRASADAIIVGSHTFHEAGLTPTWTGESVYPKAKELYTQYRCEILHKSKHPYLVVVSGSGEIDFSRAIFANPDARIVIVTSESGHVELQRRFKERATSAAVTPIAAPAPVTPDYLLALLWSRFDVHLLLHEGGPTLLGQFITAECLNELFLTLSPQIAGRLLDQPRPGLVSGVEFSPQSAPWLRLLSAKQMVDHLYFRYVINSAL